MELEQLIRTITKAVVAELGSAPEKEEVLIIGVPDCPVCQKVAQGLGSDVKVLWPEEDPGSDRAIRRIVPWVSNGDLVDLAAGKAASPLMEMALSALLAGHPVEVGTFAYTRHRDTAPAALLAVYDACREKLASFGMTKKEADLPHGYRVHTRLVREKDVQAAKEQGASTLVVAPDANVTALAEEAARDFAITILRK